MNYNEILAPAGNFEKAIAAIKGGANALYLGMTLFSARAYADNFTLKELKELITICHLRNIKVYITINTLIKNQELERALGLIGDLAELSIDALIVQDLGLIYLLKEYYPEIPLHASTQMNIHNLEGALFLEKLGLKRVILARETTLSEMRRIKENTSLEVEAFIHGALCVSQSGQCYFSQQIGGRSGNRGNCAQICRKSYRAYDREGKLVSEEKAYLSPKDLNLLSELDEIKKHIDSFKIEGRMKSPEYVYSIVKTYREKLDTGTAKKDLIKETSHREFTKGLAFGDFGKEYGEEFRNERSGRIVGTIQNKNGQRGAFFTENVEKGDIFTFQTEEGKILPLTAIEDHGKNTFNFYNHLYDGKINSGILRVKSQELLRELERDLEKLPLNFKFTGYIGQKPNLEISNGENTIRVSGEQPLEKAKKRSLDKEMLKNKFSRLGESPFTLGSIEVDLEKGSFYPVSLLNSLRRDAIKLLIERIVFSNKVEKKEISLKFPTLKKNGNREKIGNDVLIGEKIYSSQFEVDQDFYFKLPYFNTKSTYDRIYKKLQNSSHLRGFLLRNLGDLTFVKKYFPEKEMIADYTLNLWNSFSFKLLEDLGVDIATIPIELNVSELLDLVETVSIPLEGVIDDEIIVMSNRFCPFSLIYEDCNLQCKNCYYNLGFLEDEYEKRYKVKRRNQISEISFYENYRIENNELRNTLDHWRIGGAFE